MANAGAALLEGLFYGVEEMTVSLAPEQNGLLIVVTHCPNIDALAVLYTDKVDMEKTDRVVFNTKIPGFQAVKNAYTVLLGSSPVEAHNMGQYMRGRLETPDERKLEAATIPLEIKGKEYTQTVAEMRDLARTTRLAAYQGAQL